MSYNSCVSAVADYFLQAYSVEIREISKLVREDSKKIRPIVVLGFEEMLGGSLKSSLIQSIPEAEVYLREPERLAEDVVAELLRRSVN